jgi:hypothetical protein
VLQGGATQVSNLSTSIVPIVLGFVLTTVAGGLLGSFLQTRLWKHQWTVQLRSKKQDEARAVFEEVSRLMDRRLFRLSQLTIWISRQDDARAKASLSDYQDIVKEWNDSINRTISLLEFYFGRPLRDRFDNIVGGHFVKLGARVEQMYRRREKADGENDPSMAVSISDLRLEVYDYNISMLRCLDQMAAEAEPKFFSRPASPASLAAATLGDAYAEPRQTVGVAREPSRVELDR